MLSSDEIALLHASIPKMQPHEAAEVLAMLNALDEKHTAQKARDSFHEFICQMDPEYKHGTHLKRLQRLLQDLAEGKKDRIMVHCAPRFGKSQTISIYYPAWYLGNNPTHNIILASHTADLAISMSRKVRNLMQTEEYAKIFPTVSIAADAKAAGLWSTNLGGSFFAVGVGGALAGRGASLCLDGNTICIIDDKQKKLADAQIGSKIKTFYGWEKIVNKSLTIHDKAVKINSILASLNHPLLTTKGWVECKDIKLGDKLKTATLWSMLWTTVNSLRNNLRAKLGRA